MTCIPLHSGTPRRAARRAAASRDMSLALGRHLFYFSLSLRSTVIILESVSCEKKPSLTTPNQNRCPWAPPKLSLVTSRIDTNRYLAVTLIVGQTIAQSRFLNGSINEVTSVLHQLLKAKAQEVTLAHLSR